MKKFLAILATCVALFTATAMATIEETSLCSTPVFADDDGPSASILTGCAEKAKNGTEGSEGIVCILNLVLKILTYGVAALGVLGIIITGIQYMTSQGDPAKMAKAKSRLLQIIIGLVVYAIMWAALRFLVPGFGL